jgi:large subunit ribosomal protein L32
MVPKQKISRQRTRKRRSHHARKPVNYGYCPRCNQPKLPQTACSNPECGYVRPGLSLATAQES